MDERVHREVKELEKLERAAEDTVGPQQIKQRAKEQKTAEPPKHEKLGIVPYIVLALVFGGLIVLVDVNPRWLPDFVGPKFRRYLQGGLALTLLFGAAKAANVYLIGRISSTVRQFNLRRILHLVVAVVAVFIVISVLFLNWYKAVVTLGLISMILGFALQTPISSFIGWIYILARAPYRVGDRIQIGDARGDVIDVSYLDTTLWEIGGRHLSTDHPSGRLIKFPNTNVFNTPVFNYSWPLFPYVWNEIKFQIAYESDIEFVSATMQRIAEEELGESMMEKVKLYRDLLARTPVDHLEVKERPTVVFRSNDNTWLDVIVRYLVNPKEAGRVKTRLMRKLLAELNAAPDRVLFPKSNMR
jgi:small-conductance mechanosensitive channel